MGASPALQWRHGDEGSESTRDPTVLTTALDEQLLDRVQAYASSLRVSNFACLAAAYFAALAGATGQADIVVGTPLSGRTLTRFASSAGYFVNLGAIRATVNLNGSYATLVKDVAKGI